MKFPLVQLYVMNRSKPIVGIDITEVQWDTCDLSGCAPEREPGTVSMVNHGNAHRYTNKCIGAIRIQPKPFFGIKLK